MVYSWRRRALTSSFNAPLIPQVLAGPTTIIPPPRRANQASLSPLTRPLSATLFHPTDSENHSSLLSLSFRLYPHSRHLSHPLLSHYLSFHPTDFSKYSLTSISLHQFTSSFSLQTSLFIPSPSCLFIPPYRPLQTSLSQQYLPLSLPSHFHI